MICLKPADSSYTELCLGEMVEEKLAKENVAVRLGFLSTWRSLWLEGNLVFFKTFVRSQPLREPGPSGCFWAPGG